ncbi:DoxX family protein [Arthrobacter sp. PAMC25564]|uniref:DoxX family protein n=1 Tax=Arthrobacter sp. PAMC25564 TaxID=2565366 RepID=UPI0010A26F1B|nr:DoxX family protein [Arthrobacter sp. PAMC25564]QCB96985.1 DoxX family protein [Arthrobacter sp. PAMC25564]
MSAVRFLARPMLASSFVLAGMDKLKNADDTAAQLSPLLRRAAESLPFQANEKVLARVIGGTQIGAGVCFALGKSARLAATVLAVISALNGYVEWRSADISSKQGRDARRKQLLKNVSLTGGVLLASVDTAGKPSLAWRAEHLAADARKTAGHFAADARKSTGKRLKQADKAARKAVDHAVGA